VVKVLAFSRPQPGADGLFGQGNGSTGMDLSSDAKMVPLLRLAADPNLRQGTAAHHSEKSDGFPGRQDGPVKGMSF
jgi:hypothetical protein